MRLFFEKYSGKNSSLKKQAAVCVCTDNELLKNYSAIFTMTATPMPPPMHREARPYSRCCFCIS